MTTEILDLDQLRRDAAEWLLRQRSGRALTPNAIEYFHRRFCLPGWLWASIQRDEEKDPA